MKEIHTGRFSPGNLPKDTQTDWAKVKNMTETEIDAGAVSDPGAQPTDEAFWKDAQVVMPHPKRTGTVHCGRMWRRIVTKINQLPRRL